MSQRRIAWLLATSAGLLGGAVAVLKTWHPLGNPAPQVVSDGSAHFSPAEQGMIAGYERALGPWPYLGLVVVVLVPWLLWWGLGRLPPGRELRRRWPTVLAAVVVAATLQWLVAMPMRAHDQVVQRDAGISRQDWGSWLPGQAMTWGQSTLLAVVAVRLLLWLIRRAPRRWPWILAATAGVLTVVGSMLYPVVVESALTRVTPLSQGELHQQIEQLVAQEGFAPVGVEVSDASSRTSEKNDHVSGLGATHRIVLYDTVVAQAKTDPDAAMAIVAHELGHVAHHDVARGTAIGAMAALVVVFAGALGVRSRGSSAPREPAGTWPARPLWCSPSRSLRRMPRRRSATWSAARWRPLPTCTG